MRRRDGLMFGAHREGTGRERMVAEIVTGRRQGRCGEAINHDGDRELRGRERKEPGEIRMMRDELPADEELEPVRVHAGEERTPSFDVRGNRPAGVRSKTWKQPPKKPARKRRNLGKKLGGKRAAKRQMLPQPPLMAPETAAVVRKMRSARRLRNSRGSWRSLR